MSRALFGALDNAGGVPMIVRELQAAGIHENNFSTLSIAPAPQNLSGARVESYVRPSPVLQATGQLKWAVEAGAFRRSPRAVARVLAGLGMPEEEARHYQNLVRHGSTLICVFCADAAQAKRAKTILQHCGARELASTGSVEVAAPAPPRT